MTRSTDVSIEKTHPIQGNDFQEGKNSLSFFLATVPLYYAPAGVSSLHPKPAVLLPGTLPSKMQPPPPFSCRCPAVQLHRAIRKRAQRAPPCYPPSSPLPFTLQR